ncbi:amino acid/amide ABC transporter membrane protein 2, HAAT family [Burkholderia sp. D7]|nr:amino acid/amide ABC transporter membrane protein 2, HAAT family [Burkholderia sp. D7]
MSNDISTFNQARESMREPPEPVALSSAQDDRRLAAYLPSRPRPARQALPWIAALGAMIALPFIFPGPLGLSVLTQICIATTFALAYNMLLGGAGLLSFGHALYFGLGAYATAHALNYFAASIPIILIPLVGGGASLVIGGVFALFTVRKGKFTFAMISLAIGQLAYAVATIAKTWSGGDAGVRIDPTTAAQWGIDFGSPVAIYFLVAGWTWLATLAIFSLTRTPLGRLLNATRDNPERVEFVGFSPTVIRGLGLTISAGFAGIAGALYALTFQVVTLDTLSLQQTTAVMLQAYIGGYTSFLGPVVGAIVMTLVSAHLSTLTDAWPLYLGMLFMTVIVFSPRGLTGAVTSSWSRWARSYSELGIMRLVMRVVAYLAGVLLTAAGFVSCTEMVQSMSENNGSPIPLSWIAANLALDPHHGASWLASISMLLIGVIGLVLMQTFTRRSS